MDSSGGAKDRVSGSSSDGLGLRLRMGGRLTGFDPLRTRPGGLGLRGVSGSIGDEGGRREKGSSAMSAARVNWCPGSSLVLVDESERAPVGSCAAGGINSCCFIGWEARLWISLSRICSRGSTGTASEAGAYAVCRFMKRSVIRPTPDLDGNKGGVEGPLSSASLSLSLQSDGVVPSTSGGIASIVERRG